jgi:hypothetical protein
MIAVEPNRQLSNNQPGAPLFSEMSNSELSIDVTDSSRRAAHPHSDFIETEIGLG